MEPPQRAACCHAGAYPAGWVSSCMQTAVETWLAWAWQWPCWRAWRGPCRVARQGSCRGALASPARILPGVLWVPSVRFLVRIVAFLSSFDLDYSLSSQRSACHHRGASRALSRRVCEASVGSRVAHSVGMGELPRQGSCRENLLRPSDLRGLGPCCCFVRFVASAPLRLPILAVSVRGRGGRL